MPNTDPPDLDPERIRMGATARTLREKSGLKLGHAASSMQISSAYLSNIEAGRKPLTAILVARMAALYGCQQIAIVRPDLFTDAA